LSVEPGDFNPHLQAAGASFVTLHLAAELRGCIGSLEATRTLVEDVAAHAYSAGFEDPRFPTLGREELDDVSVEISVLSGLESLEARCEDDLLAQLRRDIDGLLMTCGRRRATFLPAVWRQLEDPHVFLSQLRYKAGLPLDYWSEDLSFQRYTTECFHD
jgi:AmmeMemoRadiSam system protein A